MTVYVDDIAIEWKGRKWYHLMADTDEELHRFALKIGLQRAWFQGDHYDITGPKRKHAIDLGAKPVTPLDLVKLRKAKNEANKKFTH